MEPRSGVALGHQRDHSEAQIVFNSIQGWVFFDVLKIKQKWEFSALKDEACEWCWRFPVVNSR